MRAVFLFLFLLGFFGKRRIFRIAEYFPDLLYAPAGARVLFTNSVRKARRLGVKSLFAAYGGGGLYFF